MEGPHVSGPPGQGTKAPSVHSSPPSPPTPRRHQLRNQNRDGGWGWGAWAEGQEHSQPSRAWQSRTEPGPFPLSLSLHVFGGVEGGPPGLVSWVSPHYHLCRRFWEIPVPTGGETRAREGMGLVQVPVLTHSQASGAPRRVGRLASETRP